MPRETFDVCNMIVVPSGIWNDWKRKNLKTFKKAGKEVQVFASEASIQHFKTSKNGRDTRIDDSACCVRYCSKDVQDETGACMSMDGFGCSAKFKYAGQFIGCYIGSADIIDFGKYAGCCRWVELDKAKPGQNGDASDDSVKFACSVWNLDPKKVKGLLNEKDD